MEAVHLKGQLLIRKSSNILPDPPDITGHDGCPCLGAQTALPERLPRSSTVQFLPKIIQAATSLNVQLAAQNKLLHCFPPAISKTTEL
jgi:hypothetical protein